MQPLFLRLLPQSKCPKRTRRKLCGLFRPSLRSHVVSHPITSCWLQGSQHGFKELDSTSCCSHYRRAWGVEVIIDILWKTLPSIVSIPAFIPVYGEWVGSTSPPNCHHSRIRFFHMEGKWNHFLLSKIFSPALILSLSTWKWQLKPRDRKNKREGETGRRARNWKISNSWEDEK